MMLDEENLSKFAKVFVEEKFVKADTQKTVGFTWCGARRLDDIVRNNELNEQELKNNNRGV